MYVCANIDPGNEFRCPDLEQFRGNKIHNIPNIDSVIASNTKILKKITPADVDTSSPWKGPGPSVADHGSFVLKRQSVP